MITFLSGFLVFLAAAGALALAGARGRAPGRQCGGCPSRAGTDCDAQARALREER